MVFSLIKRIAELTNIIETQEGIIVKLNHKLQPKTCDGCKWYLVSTMYAQKCRDCTHYEERSYVVDNYEAKDSREST